MWQVWADSKMEEPLGLKGDHNVLLVPCRQEDREACHLELYHCLASVSQMTLRTVVLLDP